jgi:hypothetical protein
VSNQTQAQELLFQSADRGQRLPLQADHPSLKPPVMLVQPGQYECRDKQENHGNRGQHLESWQQDYGDCGTQSHAYPAAGDRYQPATIVVGRKAGWKPKKYG